MLRAMKVGTSLYVLVSVMGAVAAGLGLLGVTGMRLVESGLEHVYTDRVVPLRDLKDVSDAFNVGGVATAQKVRDRAMTFEQGRDALRDARRTVEENWKRYTARPLDPQEAKAVAAAGPLMEKANAALDQLDRILARRQSDELELFVTIDLFPAVQPLSAALDGLIRLQLDLAKTAYLHADEIDVRTQRWSAVAIVLGLSCGFGLAAVIIRRLLRALGGEPADIAAAVASIASGDLTLKLDKKRATGVYAALQQMLQRLNGALGAASEGASTLASVSTQVSMTARSVSEGASTQAAAVQETSASLEQMSASITQNAENSRNCERVALQGASQARESSGAVKSAIEAMKSIAGKVSVIDEIAHRTNLLALNAQIEAARAGTVGRGFAVVATEVRRLAERSQAAAREIASLATDGERKADASGEQLGALVQAIASTTNFVQEVTASTAEQASGVGQITNAITQVDNATQRSAAAAEELSAVATQLASQAEQLQKQMSFFRVRAAAG
ncbi:MAG TPA: methyl-accepting chemotaxis protein [Myxococcales bacterium]|nr:methyl-accepting chemotaxis protein [Myxococcales bacterium]